MALPDWIHGHLPNTTALGSEQLADYPCDVDGQTPTSGTYRLDGDVSVRAFTCPNGHRYTEQNDGG
jgi:hypothetical protein